MMGVEDGMQIDHSYSIYEGYINEVPAEIIGHIENLELITWEENILKSKESNIILENLLEKISIYRIE